VSIVWTGYGRPAYDALRVAVADRKHADPLAPVTVLVPTQLTGVIARRALAHGVGGHPGIAGLTVLTVDRLAERIASAALMGSGRLPATDSVLAAAWRRALAEDPGVFGPVADHPNTVRALAAAHTELREVDAASLHAIAEQGGTIAADLVRLHCRVVTTLAPGWYDVTDLRRSATDALADRPGLATEIGAVVHFLPQDLPPGARALLDQLGDLHTIAALTGNPRADASVHEATGDQPQEKTAAKVLHASDADDEVRCVVRRLTSTLQHTPAHRIAVLYGAARPYARLLAEHLAAAGIRWNGAGVRPTVERTLARVLRNVLEAHANGWQRADVMGMLAGAPVRRPDGQRIPAARWERISRSAGVVAGDDWDIRLKAYAGQERAAADRDDIDPGRGTVHRADAEAADDLRLFVTGLRDRLHEGESLCTWPALAGWAQNTFAALVGDLDCERWVPQDEARAADAVARTLAGLSGLDAVEPAADLTLLALTLDLELSRDLPRHGRIGEGVLVAPLSGAVGLDADAVFVLGLAEDLVPGRQRADALLPQETRVLAGGQLPLLRDRVDRVHRHVLAAFAAAPEVTASFPRGDLRRSTTRLPSRWLLPTLRAIAGDDTVDATTWGTVAGIAGSPSFAAGLAGADALASEQEWRTRAVSAARSRGTAVVAALPDDGVVALGAAMRNARRSDALTRFDGDLSGHRLPDPTDGTVLSPTALEFWSRCPHAYFVQRLLRVSPVESPEELLRISPIELGNLFHDSLDRFFTGQDAAGAVPGGATPWTPAQRAELRRIAVEVADDLAVRGATGHRLLWRRELTAVLARLDGFLDADQRLRAQTGRRQVRSELAFGMRGNPPVHVPLPDGRVLLLRGSADRVDRVGDTITVVDYKTGNPKYFAGLGPDDPTLCGSKLQLPVYGYAARAALGAATADVSAEYWFLHKEAGKRVPLALTPQVEAAFVQAVAVIADGIAGGLFPHRPADDDGFGGYIPCGYCDPDGLGVSDHRPRWDRKRHDPRLAGYLALIEPGTP
jgi:ATP-dependent helicase/nuclease subunit B